jgi:hypothetical protein
MTPLSQEGSKHSPEVKFAILLEGISEKWQMNVLQILGRPALARVKLDGYGTIDAPAILLTQSQARHLAAQIIELLGPENRDNISSFAGLAGSS